MASRRRSAAIAAVLASGLLASCGSSTSSNSNPGPSTLTLTCGSMNAGDGEAGLVVGAVIEPARPSDVVLNVYGTGPLATMTCKAGQRLCLEAFPEITAWSDYRGELGRTPFATVVDGDVGRGLEAWACTFDLDSVLAQPDGHAELDAGQVRVTWKPVTGAATYVAVLRDLGPPGVQPPRVLGTVPTSGTQASFTLSGPAPELAVVEIEAWATDPAVPPVGNLAPGGANRSVQVIPLVGAPWALKQPSDFSSGRLDVPIPAGRRMAVILLNVVGPDQAAATIQATGTAVSSVTAATENGPGTLVVTPFGRVHPSSEAHRLAATDRLSTVAGLVAPGTKTFCVQRYDSVGNALGLARRPATLVRETASGVFYVDDDNAAEFTASDWDMLASAWGTAFASVTGYAGPPPDIDGNGKVLVFFTSALGAGAFDVRIGSDEENALDTSPDCSGPRARDNFAGSNHAELIYVHSPAGLGVSAETWRAYAESAFPSGLQVLVDFNRFGRPAGSFEPEFWLWFNGRPALAATMAGFGDHLAAIRAESLPLFQRTDPSGGGEGYPRMQLLSFRNATSSAGANSFILFLADRLGPDYVRKFFEEGTGVRQIGVLSGIPLPVAYALWTSALVFSNEPASPWRGFDYTGVDWTPLHQKFQRFEYAPLNSGAAVPVTLTTNGFDVYVTGPAGPGGGSVTVASSEAVKPYVVAIPFTGALP